MPQKPAKTPRPFPSSAIHRLQHRPMRRSAGGHRNGRAAAAQHDRTGGREVDRGDRGRFPHQRGTGLLQSIRRFRAGAASEPINWHCTAFHELGHWTGHKSRLDREHSGSFGSKSYAREELVAEMAGSFVCASLGIVPTVRHADYIGSWLEVLREDNRAPSSALPVPRPRPPTTFSAFSRSRSSVRKPPTRLTIRRQRDPGSAETQSRTCAFALVRPCGCAE